jgi:CubicO group peptidase (beta-lactamase class C family)
MHRRCFLRGALAGALLLHGAVVLHAQSARDAAIARLESRLRQDVAADSVGGITAAVVEGGSVIWVRGFGWADRDRRIAADSLTIYRIGSITKSFTAVAMMQAVRSGKVRLDEPVEVYLPEAAQFSGRPAGARPLTMRHLASHTGGLIREPQLANAAAGPIAEWEAKILASIPATRFQNAPGERYSYSNIGYGVLGLATSRAAGTPFMDLVRDGILQPLRMTSSGFVVTPEMRPHLATGYANRADGSVDAETPLREHDGRGYKVPNGGLYSTAADLAHFIAAMSGRGVDILSPTARAEMLTVQTAEGPSGYGLGFMIRVTDGVRIVEHGGSVAGYTAHIAFETETGIGVILLRNYGRGATNLGQVAAGTVVELVRAGRD